MEEGGRTPPAAMSAAGVQEGLLDIVCLVRVRGADSYHGCLGRVALRQGGCAHPSGIVWYCWLVKEARHGSKQRHSARTYTHRDTHTRTDILQDKNMHVNKPSV